MATKSVKFTDSEQDLLEFALSKGKFSTYIKELIRKDKSSENCCVNKSEVENIIEEKLATLGIVFTKNCDMSVDIIKPDVIYNKECIERFGEKIREGLGVPEELIAPNDSNLTSKTLLNMVSKGVQQPVNEYYRYIGETMLKGAGIPEDMTKSIMSPSSTDTNSKQANQQPIEDEDIDALASLYNN